jgi:hypothetical protein
VTPSAGFINHLLSTAMAMLSSKWKASYDSNRKYSSKWEEKFVWVQKAADGSEAAYCKLSHCKILPFSQIMKNLRNTSEKLRYKARHDLM